MVAAVVDDPVVSAASVGGSASEPQAPSAIASTESALAPSTVRAGMG
jgi:hypothetical protein